MICDDGIDSVNSLFILMILNTFYTHVANDWQFKIGATNNCHRVNFFRVVVNSDGDTKGNKNV